MTTDIRGTIMSMLVGRVDIVLEECYRCGVVFGMTASFREQRLKDRNSFYCPNGHSQHYIGKTDAQKLKEAETRITHLRDQRDASERTNRALRGVITKTRKRVAAGVCPCCNRTFQNLSRHMSGQHPEYAEQGGK